MRATKQVIVMRTDLNMRKGKMVAQGAHATMSFITRKFLIMPKWEFLGYVWELLHDQQVTFWLRNSFVKICVGADSEDHLIDIMQRAKTRRLRVELIEDNGTTEFQGEKTFTCLAIGPNWSDEIDKVTGDLKLL